MLKKIAGLVFVLIITGYHIYAVNYNTRGMINNFLNKREGKTLNSEFSVKIKSGNLSTDYIVDQALKDIEDLDLNTINLSIVINIDDVDSSNMSIYDNNLERAKALLYKLKSKKIK